MRQCIPLGFAPVIIFQNADGAVHFSRIRPARRAARSPGFRAEKGRPVVSNGGTRIFFSAVGDQRQDGGLGLGQDALSDSTQCRHSGCPAVLHGAALCQHLARGRRVLGERNHCSSTSGVRLRNSLRDGQVFKPFPRPSCLHGWHGVLAIGVSPPPRFSARLNQLLAAGRTMIEDIARRTAEVLPRYGATYWALLSQPVARITPRSRAGTQVWDAMLFWVVSLAIFLLTRYIAFSSIADPVLFFVSSAITALVQLVMVALAFFWVWRVFGAPYPLGSFLIATACIHGVVLPLEAVLNVGLFGIMRILDADLYRLAINSVSGCGQVTSMDALAQAMEARMQAANPAQTLRLILLFMAMSLPLFSVLIGYGVAYARVLARLTAEPVRPGSARLLLMLVLGSALAGTGLFFSALFDWALFQDPALCLQTTLP